MAAATPAKLSLLQEAMAFWEQAHPYNGGHAIRLSGRADPPALQAAIQRACSRAGVGHLILDRRSTRYHYEPVGAIELREIRASGPLVGSLCAGITQEINRPFGHGPEHPVRWLVVEDAAADSHFLAAIYRHLAADSVSMRLLLRRVLGEYIGCPEPGDARPLNVYPPPAASVLRHHHRRLGYMRTFLRAAALYFRLRHAHRPRRARDGGTGSDFVIADTPEGLLDHLAAACRSRRVTVSEAFLAALCGAVAGVTPLRRRHPRRRALAFVTFVDVRDEASLDLADCFGMYLGHSTLVVDEPDAQEFGALLAEVSGKMRSERIAKHFLGPEWNYWMALRIGRRLAGRDPLGWYRKVYPIAGGLSSVRLNRSWFGGAGERILEWIRFPPSGPVLPLVLAPTTLDGKLHLSLSYRRSALTHPEALELVERLLKRLEGFSSGGRPE